MGKQAVLVDDVLKDFTDRAGRVHHPQTVVIVPRIDSFVHQARTRGALAIWVIDQQRAGKPDWELGHVRDHRMEGTPGLELARPLEPAAEEYVISKRRDSAFVCTDLDLSDNHMNTPLLTGTHLETTWAGSCL